MRGDAGLTWDERGFRHMHEGPAVLSAVAYCEVGDPYLGRTLQKLAAIVAEFLPDVRAWPWVDREAKAPEEWHAELKHASGRRKSWKLKQLVESGVLQRFPREGWPVHVECPAKGMKPAICNDVMSMACTPWGPKDTMLYVHVRSTLLNQLADGGALLVERIGALFATVPCYYAFFDVGAPHQTLWGNLFAGIACGGFVSWRRLVERDLWDQAHDRGEHQELARGVYWANYFGPKLATKLGGNAALVASFLAADDFGGRKVAWARAYESGGALVALSECPLDVEDEDLAGYSVTQLAAWLHRELRERGLLL